MGYLCICIHSFAPVPGVAPPAGRVSATKCCWISQRIWQKRSHSWTWGRPRRFAPGVPVAALRQGGDAFSAPRGKFGRTKPFAVGTLATVRATPARRHRCAGSSTKAAGDFGQTNLAGSSARAPAARRRKIGSRARGGSSKPAGDFGQTNFAGTFDEGHPLHSGAAGASRPDPTAPGRAGRRSARLPPPPGTGLWPC